MRSFKSNENIHKKEGGSYYVVSANKASSVTLQSPGNESQRKHTAILRISNRKYPGLIGLKLITWTSRNVGTSFKIIYKAWKRYTYSRNREDYLKYRKIRNKIPKCIKHAKQKYEKGIASAEIEE